MKYILSILIGISTLATIKQGKEPENGAKYIYVFDLVRNPVHNTAVKDLYLKQNTGDSPLVIVDVRPLSNLKKSGQRSKIT